MYDNDVAKKVMDISLTKIAETKFVKSSNSTRSLHKHLLVNQVLAKAKCALTFSHPRTKSGEDQPQVPAIDDCDILSVLSEHNFYDESERTQCEEKNFRQRSDISGVFRVTEFVEEQQEAISDSELQSDEDLTESNDNEILVNASMMKRKASSSDSTSTTENKRPKMSLIRPNIYDDQSTPQNIGALISVFNSGFQGLIGDNSDVISVNELESSHLSATCGNLYYRTENIETNLTPTPLAMAV